MSLTVEFHEKLNLILLNEWQRLWKISADSHFFNSPQWFNANLRVYKTAKWLLLTVRNEADFLAFLPLIVTRRFGVKTYTSPGGKHLCRSTLLLKNNDSEVLAEILSKLAEKGNIYLPELEENLGRAAAAIGFELKESSASPYLPLKKISVLPKRQKVKIQKSYEKLKQHLVYKCFRGDLEGLDIAFEIDKHSAKRARGMPAFPSEQDKIFYRELVNTFGESVAIDILYYKKTPFVFQIGFIYKGVYHFAITAYKAEYRRLTPGRLLLFFLLTRLQAENYCMIDFSRGINDFKRDFTKSVRKQYSISLAVNPLYSLWWKIIQACYTYFQTSRIFYPAYLLFKKKFVQVA